MAKEFDNNRLKRLKIIDEALCCDSPNDDGVPLSVLIKKLHDAGIVSDRYAVGRDLKFLRELGLELAEKRKNVEGVKSQRAIKVYKYKNPGTSLFGERLTEKERNFLSDALAMLGLKGIEYLSVFRGLKLKSEKNSYGTIISFTKNPEEKSYLNIFETLFNKIEECQPISLRMRDREPPYNVVTHRVHPWYLREYNRRWYLFGYDDKENKIERYALDRIESTIRDLKRKYKAPEQPIETILKDIIGVSLTHGEVMDIIFWVSDVSADYILKKPIHRSQREVKVEEVEIGTGKKFGFEGGKYFSVSCMNNYELQRELLSFGPELIVLSPEELRVQLRMRLKKMCDNYD